MLNLNSEFLNRMKAVLGDEYDDFVKSLDRENEKAIFVNNNKINVEDFQNLVDFDIEKISYEPNGFYVGQQRLGRHPLHHAGAIYVQEPSAMYTVNALEFKGDEKVLDICAAPGGKSIQIANRIPNGFLVSNEINKSRSEILFSNIERMGLRNVIITNDSPDVIAKAYANCFDVCLVDAPCSGEGMFRKGDDMIKNWNPNLNESCAIKQLEILEDANEALKQYGFLIYSTCTYSVLENEDVINKFISKHAYKIIDINHQFTKGINMPKAARLYPHKVRGEGQFVVLLQKLEENNSFPYANLKLQQHKKTDEFIKKWCNFNLNSFEYKNFSYYIPNLNMIKKGVNYVSLGVKLCDISTKDIVPHHNLFTAFGSYFINKLNFNFSDNQIAKYVRGETLDVDIEDCYGAIICSNCSLGGFKVSKGKFKNYYPKGLRNF